MVPLNEWFTIAEKASWSSFSDVKATFGSVDKVGDRYIFNIGGNNYRLIAKISFDYQNVFIRWIGTHAEYDRLSKEDIKNL